MATNVCLWLRRHLGLNIEDYVCHLFQIIFLGRVVSCRDEKSHRLYMTLELCVFVSELKSHPSTVTWVNSHWYDSLWFKIFCWYHENKYRATRGNQSELIPELWWTWCITVTTESTHLARLAYMLADVGFFKMASVNNLIASSRFPFRENEKKLVVQDNCYS